jgi:hypothetical protein
MDLESEVEDDPKPHPTRPKPNLTLKLCAITKSSSKAPTPWFCTFPLPILDPCYSCDIFNEEVQY